MYQFIAAKCLCAKYLTGLPRFYDFKKSLLLFLFIDEETRVPRG